MRFFLEDEAKADWFTKDRHQLDLQLDLPFAVSTVGGCERLWKVLWGSVSDEYQQPTALATCVFVASSHDYLEQQRSYSYS